MDPVKIDRFGLKMLHTLWGKFIISNYNFLEVLFFLSVFIRDIIISYLFSFKLCTKTFKYRCHMSEAESFHSSFKIMRSLKNDHLTTIIEKEKKKKVDTLFLIWA